LTFRHRAGVRPHTAPCGFAEPCVFSKQSLPPGLCPPPAVARPRGPLLPKLRGQFAEFLQHRSPKRLGMLYQSTCVGFGYGLTMGLFPGSRRQHAQSGQGTHASGSVTSIWPRTLDLVPIGYASRPRLRGRLTLRGLTVRRNPWTSGDGGSRPVCRYSCQHSRFRTLHAPSRPRFTADRNAPLPRGPPQGPASIASARGLSPGTSSARAGLPRPVSYYAFFKGWLLLSQPPGCPGRPTSFPT
jgi:hypothetical protein